jgi:hypothetical protein
MDALRTVSAGFENAQNMQNARAAQNIAPPRERDGVQPALRPEQPGVAPSSRVELSEAARAAARSGSPSSPPPLPANTPAAPVQTQEAIVRAGASGNIGRAERHDAAAFTAAEAVQRYTENASHKLPAGQSGPSSVRVSA